MSAQVNFQEVKQAVTVEHVIGFLGLKLTQKEDSFRGVCPLCKSGSREFVITGSKRLFYCFKCKKGGTSSNWSPKQKGSASKKPPPSSPRPAGLRKKPNPRQPRKRRLT